MNFNELEKLITLIDKSSIASFDYDTGTYKVRITKDNAKDTTTQENIQLPMEKPINMASSESSATILPNTNTENILIVKSPLVGSFHTHQEDKSKPFVKVGDFVKKDQVLCAIEAMKIFNTISSPIDGVVIEILCQDGDIVDFDKDLIILQKG